MQSDRELLEAAAKAAGLTIEYWAQEDYPVVRDGDKNVGWNPLTFDSDALRLAVKLEIQAGYTEFSGEGVALWNRGDNQEREYGPEDPCAATRRAIVRAAAAMGEKA